MAYEVHNFQSGAKLYASQLNEMDTQIKAHDSALYSESVNVSATESDWKQGLPNMSSNAYDYSRRIHLSIKTPITLNIQCTETMSYGVSVYSDIGLTNRISDTGWVSTVSMNIECLPDSYYVIAVRDKTSGNNQITTALGAKMVVSYVHKELSLIDEINQKVQNIQREALGATVIFTMGGVNKGVISPSTVAAYTNQLETNLVHEVAVSRTDINWLVYVDYWDKDGNWVTRDETQYRNATITVNTNYPFVSLLCQNFNNNSWSNPMDIEKLKKSIKFPGAMGVLTKVQDMISESLHNVGSSNYTGERVVLKEDADTFGCDIVLWKDFTNVPAYNFYLNQSLTIYNGYVFLFMEQGSVVIMDYATKNVVGTSALGVTSGQHSNTAQFTDYYYDSADTYPILLISRCDGNGTDYARDAAQFFRVQQDGNSFTFTLINTLEFDVVSYGITHGWDASRKRLVMSYMANGNWQVTTNNPVRFCSVHAPTRAEIMSGTTIHRTESDVISTMQTDFLVPQAMCVKNGLCYHMMQIPRPTAPSVRDPYVYVFDIDRGCIASKIPLISNLEPQGIGIYNGMMYVGHKNGADTAGANPMKIYEIKFD